MMATEPVIAMEKGHRVGMNGRDFLPWMSEQGELHIKGEFLQDVQFATVIDETIHSIDDEAA